MKSTPFGRYGWLERKQERTEYYKRFVEGWRLRKCGACNGSGHYDGGRNNPKCGACDGTGKERYRHTNGEG